MTLVALALAAAAVVAADADPKFNQHQKVTITVLEDGSGVDITMNGKRMNCAQFNAFLAKGSKDPDEHPSINCTTGQMKFPQRQ